MSLRNELDVIAKGLLDEFGENATFTRTIAGEYDPNNLEAPQYSTEIFSGKVHPSTYNSQEIDGEVIKRDDIKLYCHTMDQIPKTEDIVLLNGSVYTVLNVTTLRVQGGDVLYIVQARN